MPNIEPQKFAQLKYQLFAELDPFYDEIPPALLNSADITDYVNAIGMVYPFEPVLKGEKLLKGTTLSLRLGGECIYWNEKKKKVRKIIDNGDEFILKSNSIAYISILEHIRLPRYIIARFNLRVTNAYRGILLGTGPIVDPGFNGKLSIPLHNLTNNDYVFYGGNTIIEMEFTKLSPNILWEQPIPTVLSREFRPVRSGEYEPWKPEDKLDTLDRNLDYYLMRANSGRRIESSLPILVKDTKDAIDKATKTSEKVDTSLSRINVGLLFSFGALLGAIIAIVNVFRSDIKEIKDKKLEEKVRFLEEQHSKDSETIKIVTDSLRKRKIIP